MSLVRSLRCRWAFPVVAAAVVAVACSSDSVTGPNTNRNARLILRFDTLMNSASDGFRVNAYSDIAALLAEGAPVGTGTITVNGAPERFNVVAASIVDDLDGVPQDSQYTVAAWQGDGSDSLAVFNLSGNTIAVLVSSIHGSTVSFGGTATMTQGAPGAACKSFLAVTPPDIFAPQPIQCRLQSASATFAIVLNNGQGDTVALPNQTVAGIRLEFEAPPPPVARR